MGYTFCKESHYKELQQPCQNITLNYGIRDWAILVSKDLIELSKQGLLTGNNIDKLKFCENRALEKSKRLKFSKSQHKTT